MTKIEEFKDFVRTNPSLINYVKNDQMTWQKFYELFDLYGQNNEIWNDYLKKDKDTKITKPLAVNDVMAWLKNIDLDVLGENINSIQRVIGVLQDFGTKDTSDIGSTYKPRPIYKHFED